MKTKKRKHFGVLLSSIEENCQSEMWQGVESFAHDNDINLTLYVATFQQKTGKLEEHYPVVFDAIKDNNELDGLIIFSGFIEDDIGEEDLLAFINDTFGLPKVSVAMNIKDIASIMVDNSNGTYQVTNHIIKDHSNSRVAFVKGPEGHQEAEARLEGYKKALIDNDLAIDENLILPGHFNDEDGAEAVKTLLRDGIMFDSIVAADDDTAIGVINELVENGVMVPANIAVGGFDDSSMASIVTPSLTTVHQPFFEMGYKSVETLIDILEHREVKQLEFLNPKLIKRQSCRCVDAVNTVVNCYPSLVSTLESLITDVNVAAKEIFKGIDIVVVEQWVISLCTSLTTKHFTSTQFLESFDSCLISYNAYGKDLLPWRDLLSVLLAGIEKLYLEDRDHFNKIGQSIYQASWLINKAQSRERQFDHFEIEEVQWQIRGMAQEIVTSFDFDELQGKLMDAADELDLGIMVINLYSKSVNINNWKKPLLIETVIALDKRKKLTHHNSDEMVTFNNLYETSSYNLLRKRKTLLFMPLFFGRMQIGLMLFEYRRKMPIDMYESLRISVATALKGATLIQDVRNISITDELTGLYNRRGFLTLSFSQLKQFRRSGASGAVFFIDMDGLKNINDTYGHIAGDEAITACADVLKESLRDADIIGRMGGDEFTIFASNIDSKNIEFITNRIRKSFDEYNETSNKKYRVDASIGAQMITDFSEKEFSKILSQADRLLYEEKEEKRRRGIGRL